MLPIHARISLKEMLNCCLNQAGNQGQTHWALQIFGGGYVQMQPQHHYERGSFPSSSFVQGRVHQR